jgi:hypothetical protein
MVLGATSRSPLRGTRPARAAAPFTTSTTASKDAKLAPLGFHASHIARMLASRAASLALPRRRSGQDFLPPTRFQGVDVRAVSNPRKPEWLGLGPRLISGAATGHDAGRQCVRRTLASPSCAHAGEDTASAGRSESCGAPVRGGAAINLRQYAPTACGRSTCAAGCATTVRS